MDNNNRLKQLKDILTEANAKGLDVTDLMRQVDSVIAASESKTIKIVLMGAYSDGKTTVIAGLTGQLESNMKIAIEESSDELTFYHLPALGYDFEIVDTPGLFGSKERSIEGRQVRYSDITREYISQAHIILYVSDAGNPLKDTHKDILKFTLRDLGKLPNTIFVINKMDEAGYELSDEEDYSRGCKIKKNTFTQSLDEAIHLTTQERESLNIICIAANPNGRGLEKHFERMESYLKRSRIDKLRKGVVDIASSSNKDSLRSSASESSVTDLASQTISNFDMYLKNSTVQIEELRISANDTRTKLSHIRSVTLTNKGLLQQELANTQEEMEIAIENASMKDLGHTVNKYFGENGERLDRTINQLFSTYSEMNNVAFQQSNIQNSFDKMSDLTKNLINSSSKFLKHTKIGADTVKTVRDAVASSYKFKPWGAIKLGKNISKALGAISIAIDIFMWWKARKEEKKFQEAKEKIIQSTKDCFRKAETYLSTEKTYFENFAPGVLSVEAALADTEDNIKSVQMLKDEIFSLRTKLAEWCKNSNDSKIMY